MDNYRDMLSDYVHSLYGELKDEYSINEEYYENQNIKRGLRNADGSGVLAGVTRIGSVQGYYMEDGERLPQPGKLFYRGIDVDTIIEEHRKSNTFGYEEVAYLLLMGKLPTSEQYEMFDTVLSKARQLPDRFTEDTILKAPSRDIMNKLASCVLALYSYDDNPDDTSLENIVCQSIGLIARFPVIVANAYRVKRHHFEGKSLYLHNPKERLSVSENFLRMLRKDKSYTDDEAKLLDLMLIIHAEHGGGNNSAFACRTLSSSDTDTYSAISAAVGSLKGPLHGGANTKVMQMFAEMRESVGDEPADPILSDYLWKLVKGTAGDGSGKIYGLGHAVYTLSDPRAVMIKKYAKDIAAQKGRLEEFELMERIERLGIPIIMEHKNMDTPICANVDMYSGLVYSMLDIPQELYTPLFAIARITGWCAHRIEEVMTGKRIIRPAFRAAVKKVPYVAIGER